MMAPQEIVEIINSVGFPIVDSGALFWLNVHSLKQQRIMLRELEKTISKNTHVISSIAEKVKS